MHRLPWMIVGIAAFATAGCEPVPVSDLLRITYGSGEHAPPVLVDVNCNNGGCDGLEQLEAELTFEEGTGFIPSDATVEILQYRVDYDLDGLEVEEQPPFYAGVTTVLVTVGETVTFNVRAAGQRQRDWMLSHFGADQFDGEATITLAGYDHRNEIVFADAPFDISFGDFVTGESPQ